MNFSAGKFRPVLQTPPCTSLFLRRHRAVNVCFGVSKLCDLGQCLHLPGPSSLPLCNVDGNPCSASLGRLSGHQMGGCAWKYFARLMLTFQPAKYQSEKWEKGWRPGLGRGWRTGALRPTGHRQPAALVRLPHSQVLTDKLPATSVVSFDATVHLCDDSVPRVASACCQLVGFHEGGHTRSPVPGVSRLHPPPVYLI